jgi:2-polyprenyl-6-methoxyphenol hydroxylase-like FAD-dependent oxidoreductase
VTTAATPGSCSSRRTPRRPWPSSGSTSRSEQAGSSSAASPCPTPTAPALGTFPAADGPYYYLHRHTLFHTLLASARQHGVDIRYGTALTGVETSDGQVSAVFCDGTRRNADLLVGADGVRSQIRQAIDPTTAPSYTGQWFVHGLTPPGGSAYSEPEQVQVVRGERGHSFGWITTDDGATRWWLRITDEPLAEPFVQADQSTREQLLATAPRGCPAAEIIIATCGGLSS